MSPELKPRCKFYCERRIKGRMYVSWRRHCKRPANGPDGYCSRHRYYLKRDDGGWNPPYVEPEESHDPHTDGV
jgi:hypothetical protein